MIRKATPDDFESIKDLNQQIFNYEHENCDPFEDKNYPNTEFGQQFYYDICHFQNGHSGWVFEDGGKVVAYVSLREVKETEHRHRKGLKLMQLQTLCVDECYRGRGIGRQLVTHAKKIAKDLGFSHLKVVALAKNETARNLYKSCDFYELEIAHEVKL